jgi:hypothetical protein
MHLLIHYASFPRHNQLGSSLRSKKTAHGKYTTLLMFHAQGDITEQLES